MSMLTGSELDRYEAFRRSSLKKPLQRVRNEKGRSNAAKLQSSEPRATLLILCARQVMHIVTGVNPKPQDKAMIALASVAKTFVGQLVETGETRAW